jgi:hypothetical protein
MTQITLNGSEVKVEEVNGKTVVSIDSPDADIVVNGICIWSKYDKPEYNEVPVPLRSFIHERNDYLKKEDDKVVADLWYKESHTCATLYIPMNKRKAIIARLDLITDMNELEHDYLRNRENIDSETADSLVTEFNELFSNIKNLVKEAGYKLFYSHGSGELLQGWWDVSFQLDKWNEEQFLLIWNSFTIFNDRLKNVYQQYGL